MQNNEGFSFYGPRQGGNMPRANYLGATPPKVHKPKSLYYDSYQLNEDFDRM